MENTPQEIYQERVDIQTCIIENFAKSEHEIIAWIESHGRNFELFFDSISPDARDRYAQAVHEQDEEKKNELIAAFTDYESRIRDSHTVLH